MRLPYLQLTQETWSKARMLSVLLGVKWQEAFAIICTMWQWALELTPDDAPPTGICAHPQAKALLAAAVDYGDPKKLFAGLKGIGYAEAIPGGGLRVRGIARYARAWLVMENGRLRRLKQEGYESLEDFYARNPHVPRPASLEKDGRSRVRSSNVTRTFAGRSASDADADEEGGFFEADQSAVENSSDKAALSEQPDQSSKPPPPSIPRETTSAAALAKVTALVGSVGEEKLGWFNGQLHDARLDRYPNDPVLPSVSGTWLATAIAQVRAKDSRANQDDAMDALLWSYSRYLDDESPGFKAAKDGHPLEAWMKPGIYLRRLASRKPRQPRL